MPSFRIAGMSVALILCVYSIYHLNTNGLRGTFLATLFNYNVQFDEKSDAQQMWSWCHTRVTKLSMKHPEDSNRDFKMYQEKMNWFADMGDKIHVSQVGMELWLAKYCSVPVQAIEGDSSNIKRIDYELSIEFIDGKALNLSFSKAGELMYWNSKAYKASKFIEALKLLPNPPQNL